VIGREVEELQRRIAAERDPKEAGSCRRELVRAKLELGDDAVAKNHVIQIEAADIIDAIVRQCKDGDRAVAAQAAAETSILSHKVRAANENPQLQTQRQQLGSSVM
jgi:hypothetical protein